MGDWTWQVFMENKDGKPVRRLVIRDNTSMYYTDNFDDVRALIIKLNRIQDSCDRFKELISVLREELKEGDDV